MNQFDFKKLLPYFGVLLFFVGISLGYFYPQLQGKRLATHDNAQWRGGAEEINKEYEESGRIVLWSNSMFGGMPAYYVGMHYSTNLILEYVWPVAKLGIERPALYIVWSLISFFILMMVLETTIPIAVLGSIGYAFSSYNFVVIAAGHFSKVLALGFLPGILAGALLIRKGKYLAGFTVTALFMSFEMISNHPQMTYYFFVFFMVVYYFLSFLEDVKNKEVKNYLVSAVLFGTAVILGVLPSAAQLLTTQEYTPYSTRGKSELTITNTEDATTGLDRSYITTWSNGIDETWSLLIPHAKGPNSSALAAHETAMKSVDRQYQKSMEGFSAYWGDQPFIGGPMYAGAIIMFLFVLGLFIVDGMLKWSLVFATVFTTMLSWGKNFPGLTNFFIDYFPMYNKFRAVVSIEIVALFAIPLLAALALKKIFENKEFLSCPLELFGQKCKITNERAIWVAFALTGGISFLFYLLPTTFFDFFQTGEYDNYVQTLQKNGWPEGQLSDLLQNVENARIALFKADAIRTFGFILVATGLLFGYAKEKLQANTVMYALVALVLIDMWGVNTRYMDVTSGFESSRKVDKPFEMSAANQAILEDSQPGYRVLNVAVSTFNETGTSFFHHSIGGYNGAKMKKYQELVDFYLNNEIQIFRTGLQNARTMEDVNPVLQRIPVLNMLNTKYIIFNPDTRPITNSGAQGGAWFVNTISWVENADEEMQALGQNDLRNTAIIRNDQKHIVSEAGNGNGSIQLVEYDMDRLVYQSNSTSDQVALFSEIYYPVGWTATIDGQEVEIGRANYLLRTIAIPAGEHQIEFVFEPTSFYTGEKIALAGSSLLILLILGSVYFAWKNRLLPSKQE
jgi:hypothetical protein